MKKFAALAVALTMLLCLTACGGTEDAQETTASTEPSAPAAAATENLPETQPATEPATEAPAQEETQAPVVDEGTFCFTLNGVTLVPGTEYDASLLPSPSSVYQVPSCAIEGTDNVYSFDTVEITAFHDGTREIIYSIVILDPNVTTDEGLYLGDDTATVISLYGENYQEAGASMVYTRGNTMLTLILQGDYVVDIEFSWIVE